MSSDKNNNSNVLAGIIAASGATINNAPQAVKRQQTIFGACYSGDAERIEKYIRDGGCLEEGDKERMTMLHHAVVGHQNKICSMLLEGAEHSTVAPIPVDAGDSSGWTALHYAADKGFDDLITLLVEEGGAAVNSKDEMKRTPLHLAANAGNTEAVKVLLAKGAAKGLKTVVGWTALKYAEENGHADIAALLS